MTVKVAIIRPSSREKVDLLPPRLTELREAGFIVEYRDIPEDPKWTYTAGTAADRAAMLTSVVMDNTIDVIIAARGGYGASDLLPLLPWQKLTQMHRKLLVGFSDISALQSAFYCKLGWQSLHGPMPATKLWGSGPDISQLLSVLKRDTKSATIKLQPVNTHATTIKGRLFGGCFTVLTNLIGTPYFPQTLADHILFIEDTDESPARLMRAFNQWLQAGKLDGAKALVIGHLKGLGEQIPDCAEFVLQEFAKRSPIPVFHSPMFGHTTPNYPLLIGGDCEITQHQLTWHVNEGALA